MKTSNKVSSRVKDGQVTGSPFTDEGQNIEVGTASWFDWLEKVASFAYEDAAGSFTARKEQLKHGKGYWKAYRKRSNKLFQFYLGKSEDLTLEKLQEVSRELSNRIEAAQPASPLAASSSASTSAGDDASDSLALDDVGAEAEDSTEAVMMNTKLRAPVLRRRMVIRPRLLEKLNEIEFYKLSLLSAPPGFGKTTLVVQWLKNTQAVFSWLTLDAQDNDPARFWRYFTQALETFKPGISQAAAELFRPLSERQLVAALTNQLAALPEDAEFVLVLDDYHLIHSAAVHQSLQLLVERLPIQLHLVIISRSDPPLPLARMRARGELNEIKVNDLRFTLDESQTFFQEVMGLTLDEPYLLALEKHTEGWIAGMQLAGLGLQGQPDAYSFITSFQGNHRFVFDYLAEEVLEQQSPVIRNFLVQTSILGQLSASLVEAVTGCENGQAQLEQLESSNLFVIALDQERHWYRYHNLFAEYLKSRLQLEQPEHVALLHRWAALWYEEQGMPVEAIEHSILAKDMEQVADLLEKMAVPFRRGEWLTLKKWLSVVPESLIARRPRLTLNYVWVLINDRQLSLAENWLNHLLAGPGESVPATVSPPEWHAELINARAWLAFNQGNAVKTLELCREVLKLKRTGGAFIQLNFLGLIEESYPFNDVEEIARTYALAEELVEASRRLKQPFVTLLGLYILFTLNRQHANFRETYRLCQEIIQIIEQEPWLEVYSQRLLLLIWLTMGLTSYYLNKLSQAEREIRQSIALARRFQNYENEYLFITFLARVKQAEQDREAVADLLEEARLLEPKCNPADSAIASAHAAIANIWLQNGNLAGAIEWAERQPVTPETRLSIVKEWTYIVLAQVQLARRQYNQAEELLSRLLDMATQAGRQFLMARTASLLAVVHHQQGQTAQAMARLKIALEIAERENLEQILLENGQPILDLLAACLNTRTLTAGQTAFVQRLLSYRRKADPVPPVTQPLSKPFTARSPLPEEKLVEPLSEREQQVLRLLTTSLSSIEIGQELYVATSTVRTHVKNIYAKLGVQSRLEAINRARELHLL